MTQAGGSPGPHAARSHIYVDADACPVKDEVLRVAGRHGLDVTLVSDGGIRPSRYPGANIVVVRQGADAADDWIVERIGSGDIAVTGDIPLAARCLEKGAHVLGPAGKPMTAQTIGMALAMRDLNQHLRETGAIAGYNPAFSASDRSRFLGALEQMVRRVQAGVKRSPTATGN